MEEAWQRAEASTDLDIVEEPGTGLPVVQCAYCSRGYTMLDKDDEPEDLPSKCRRCGAPMDWDGVHKAGGYADQQAEIKAEPRRTRNRMVRQPAKAKGDS